MAEKLLQVGRFPAIFMAVHRIVRQMARLQMPRVLEELVAAVLIRLGLGIQATILTSAQEPAILLMVIQHEPEGLVAAQQPA